MKVKEIIFLFFTLLAGTLFAEVTPQNFLDVKIASIYDADTFKVYLDCAYPIFCKKIPVRVKNIDAPEIKTKDKCEKAAAQKAKKLTQEFLKGKIVLRNCERDKYFRLLCEVKRQIISENGLQEFDLAEMLLQRQLSYGYYGGTKEKRNWCEIPTQQAEPAEQPQQCSGQETQSNPQTAEQETQICAIPSEEPKQTDISAISGQNNSTRKN